MVAAAFAQVSPKPEQALTVQQVMTPERLRNAVVANLEPDRQRALDLRLNELASHVIKATLESRQAQSCADLGSCHWVEKVIKKGEVVLLEDRSFWEMTARDRISTMLWLAITSITVAVAPVPVGKHE